MGSLGGRAPAPGRGLGRHVLEFRAGRGAAQHQAAAAHIAAADELGGKKQAVREDFGQRLNILGFGDAAQQDDLALAPAASLSARASRSSGRR